MSKILMALGGVALGVAAYTLGEVVQKRRAELDDEDYGIVDFFQEICDDSLQTLQTPPKED